MTIFRLVFNVRTTFPWFGSCAVRDYARDDLSFASFSIMVGEVHSFKWISQNVSRTFVELCMETSYWCTVLVHQYGRRKSIKHLEFTFSMTALSFHSRTSIRAHKHISTAWNGYTAENQEERLFFNETAFLFWCHVLWKLGSSNCCIFEMKHATGIETCTRIYFLFIFNLV